MEAADMFMVQGTTARAAGNQVSSSALRQVRPDACWTPLHTDIGKELQPYMAQGHFGIGPHIPMTVASSCGKASSRKLPLMPARATSAHVVEHSAACCRRRRQRHTSEPACSLFGRACTTSCWVTAPRRTWQSKDLSSLPDGSTVPCWLSSRLMTVSLHC
jgi:hypothetical protein